LLISKYNVKKIFTIFVFIDGNRKYYILGILLPEGLHHFSICPRKGEIVQTFNLHPLVFLATDGAGLAAPPCTPECMEGDPKVGIGMLDGHKGLSQPNPYPQLLAHTPA
jgi:hypothetical protein